MYDREALEGIKALTSGINIPTNINVKYSMAFVKCRPCIHILNNHEYEKFKRIAATHGGMAWWGRNSKTVEIPKPIFKLDSEILQEKMELENTMSENSINVEENEYENEQQEEEEEEKTEENQEKKPKEYTRQNKHSFRSRFKHALRYSGMEEDDIQELLRTFDEKRLKGLKEKEKIEYGFEDEDDIENHPSIQEEHMLDNIQKPINEDMLSQKTPFEKRLEDYDNDDYESEDAYGNDLPPSTRYFNTGHEAPDGIIYDRFDD